MALSYCPQTIGLWLQWIEHLGILLGPFRRQRLEQVIELECAGLAPGKDRLDDAWSQQRQP